jgi:hypothetical protein
MKRLPTAVEEAMAWARRLPLGNPFAKSILRALAMYMNENGAAWPGVATLAQDTDLSEDTIVGRLRWCESIGAIAIINCWVDDNGNRNYGGRGRVTSHEIRFLFDADIDEIAARALGAANPRPLRGAAFKSQEEARSRHRREPNDAPYETSGSRQCREQTDEAREAISSFPGSGLAPELPPTPAARREELEPESDSPPKSPSGGRLSDDLDSKKADQWLHLASWKLFEAAWVEPILRQRVCRKLWSAFTDAEREQLLDVARGYVAWRIGQKRPPARCNAETILRERDAWASYIARVPQPPKPAAAATKSRLVVGSAEYIAFDLACRIGALVMPGARGDPPAVEIAGEVPHGALALARLASAEQWVVRKRGTNEFNAWCERVEEWTGLSPRIVRYWVDANDNVVPKHKAYRRSPREGENPKWIVPKSIDGLLVPPTRSGFPPPKGGQEDATESAARSGHKETGR